MKKNRFFSYLFLLFAYGTALSIAFLVFSACTVYFSPIAAVLTADLVSTGIIFLFSFLTNNSSVYDPYWSLIPPFIALLFIQFTIDSGNESRQYLMLILISIWSVRLTFNFLEGWKGLRHEDWRYMDLRKRFPKNYWFISFFGIHLIPTLIVFAGCLPVFVAFGSNEAFGIYDYIAIAITLSGIILEAVSDEQLRKFKKRRTVSRSFLDKGLWKYSRHPNYFGEVMFWTGLFVFSCSAKPFVIWTISGPLIMFCLFVFISIPMMDKRILMSKNGYDEYKRSTSSLIPFLPK